MHRFSTSELGNDRRIEPPTLRIPQNNLQRALARVRMNLSSVVRLRGRAQPIRARDDGAPNTHGVHPHVGALVEGVVAAVEGVLGPRLDAGEALVRGGLRVEECDLLGEVVHDDGVCEVIGGAGRVDGGRGRGDGVCDRRLDGGRRGAEVLGVGVGGRCVVDDGEVCER